MTHTSNQISGKYILFRHNVKKTNIIQYIEYDNHKADILTKILQGELFVGNNIFLWGWQDFIWEGAFQQMSSSDLNEDIMV